MIIECIKVYSLHSQKKKKGIFFTVEASVVIIESTMKLNVVLDLRVKNQDWITDYFRAHLYLKSE